MLIYNRTKIDMFFLEKFKNIVEFEKVVATNPRDIETLRDANTHGFQRQVHRSVVGHLSQKGHVRLCGASNIFPVYKMIDTCASEFLLLCAVFLFRPTRRRTNRR